jgi:hypothetical protein
MQGSNTLHSASTGRTAQLHPARIEGPQTFLSKFLDQRGQSAFPYIGRCFAMLSAVTARMSSANAADCGLPYARSKGFLERSEAILKQITALPSTPWSIAARLLVHIQKTPSQALGPMQRFGARHPHCYRAALNMPVIGVLALGGALSRRLRTLALPRLTPNDFDEYRLVASSPQASHPARHPRAKSSIRDGLLHASITSYISSGLRECSRFRVAT